MPSPPCLPPAPCSHAGTAWPQVCACCPLAYLTEVKQLSPTLCFPPCLPPAKQSRRDRVAAKFVEAEFEKCDRLMEIYARYEGRVAAEETR